MLAPIVAFVPTTRPENLCTKNPYAADKTLANINNNLVALGVALVLALVIAIATVLRADKARRPTIRTDSHAVWGVVLSGALLACGIVWYFVSRSSFLDHAHSGGAGVLFVLVGVVVFINGLSTPRVTYRRAYLVVALAMALTVVVLLVVGFSIWTGVIRSCGWNSSSSRSSSCSGRCRRLSSGNLGPDWFRACNPQALGSVEQARPGGDTRRGAGTSG